jgi:Ca2+-dependent lipid-binding protein
MRFHKIIVITFLLADSNGTSDPFAIIGQNPLTEHSSFHQVAKTHVIKKELNPVWTDKFEFDVEAPHLLSFVFYDKDLVGKDFLGSVSFDPRILLHLFEKSGKPTITYIQAMTAFIKDHKPKIEYHTVKEVKKTEYEWCRDNKAIVEIEFAAITKL